MKGKTKYLIVLRLNTILDIHYYGYYRALTGPRTRIFKIPLKTESRVGTRFANICYMGLCLYINYISELLLKSVTF